MNVERLRWINSRHIRALFADDDSISEQRKQAVIDEVLPFISSSISSENEEKERVLSSFDVEYIWSAMNLMKVSTSHVGGACHSS